LKQDRAQAWTDYADGIVKQFPQKFGATATATAGVK
jgi:hypothetical protein